MMRGPMEVPACLGKALIDEESINASVLQHRIERHFLAVGRTVTSLDTGVVHISPAIGIPNDHSLRDAPFALKDQLNRLCFFQR